MSDPWIHESFGKSANYLNGTRLLILGESQYDDRPGRVGTCDPGMTKWVVENMALAGSHRFFTHLTQLVSGRRKSDMTSEEIAAVWASVMFHNYVPVIAAEKPGVPPTPKMFEMGREPFLRNLEKHDPDAILVCGHRLWWHVMTGLPDHLKDGAENQPFRRIGRAVAARMKHPGWAFNSLKQHHALFVELLRRARGGTGGIAS